MKKGTAEIIIHSKPDGYGRQSFTMRWPNTSWNMDTQPIRGQCFHAVVKAYTDDMKERGIKVVVREDFS